MNVNRYNDFVFESITDEIFMLFESEESNTYVWDFSDKKANKLKDFLSNLPKEKVMEYLIKFLDKVKILPKKLKRKVLINYASIFLLFVSANYINSYFNTTNVSPEIRKIEKELVEVNKKSNFDECQEVVAKIEGGYSNDRKDIGNFIELGNGLKRFIGSKFGISAPILKDYLGKLPTKEDMKNLSYETALKIYKNKYWDDQNITHFNNQSVATTIYDACVNQGIGGTKVILKKALRDNGIDIGTKENPFKMEWIEKANELDQEKLFNDIQKHRLERYKEARTWKDHGDGWQKRLDGITFK